MTDTGVDVARQGPPWLDSSGRSPWVGTASTFEEYKALALPAWTEPYPEKPDQDLLEPGFNGHAGLDTNFRLGLELWLPGYGFLYREALSCQHTALNARMRAALQYLEEKIKPPVEASIYLTEGVTPMYQELSRKYPNLVGSEFFTDTATGQYKDGVRCENVMDLTFDNGQFDFILSFDVLEHVPNYKKAMMELSRVMKKGGTLLLTVPISLESYQSHIRAVVAQSGDVIHILDPQYHGNPLGPPSLCFTSFGFDFVEDLRKFGFNESFAVLYANRELGYWGPAQPLIVAVK